MLFRGGSGLRRGGEESEREREVYSEIGKCERGGEDEVWC